MPIDKFGRHMLRTTPYQQLPISSSPYYICEPTTFYTPCIITIRGSFNKGRSTSFYELENNGIVYTLPVSGVVKDININPTNKIFINSKSYDTTTLLGQKLAKGDQLGFPLVALQSHQYLQIVLLCPLLKDVDV